MSLETLISQQDTTLPTNPMQQYGLILEGEKKSPLFGDKGIAEQAKDPLNKDRRAYGALPYLGTPEESMHLFQSEAEYFSTHYKPKDPGAPPWRDATYAEGMILFEAKFGKKLSEFTEEVLQNYPPIQAATHPGRILSLFGLSGAGKSTAIEAAKELFGKNTIVMDSDTVRYNLFAKMIKDIESQHGANLQEIRTDLINNKISGALYLMLNHITKELKARGYNIIRSSALPDTGVDAAVYLPHPDGIDPRDVTDAQIPEVAKRLYERTQSRISQSDDYDWEHAETITEFNTMRNVTVQVPERVHAIFLKNIREALGKPGIKKLRNKRIDDPAARKQAYQDQLRPIIDAMEK